MNLNFSRRIVASLFGTILLFGSGSLFAESVSFPLPTLYTEISGGLGYQKSDFTADVNISPTSSNYHRLINNSDWKTLVSGGISSGLLFPLGRANPDYGIQNGSSNGASIGLGVSAKVISFKPQKGIIIPVYNINPSGDTFDYEFKMISFPIFGEARIMLGLHGISAVGILGYGASFNKLYDFSAKPTDPSGSLVSFDPYADKLQLNKAYEFGVSLLKKISDHYSAGIDYRYISLGKPRLGKRNQSVEPEIGSLKVHLLNLVILIK